MGLEKEREGKGREKSLTPVRTLEVGGRKEDLGKKGLAGYEDSGSPRIKKGGKKENVEKVVFTRGKKKKKRWPADGEEEKGHRRGKISLIAGRGKKEGKSFPSDQ